MLRSFFFLTQQEFGILSRYVVFVTDNGANVIAALKEYIRLSCAGQNANLALKDVFDRFPQDSPIMQLLAHAKTLVTHFKRRG